MSDLINIDFKNKTYNLAISLYDEGNSVQIIDFTQTYRKESK